MISKAPPSVERDDNDHLTCQWLSFVPETNDRCMCHKIEELS